MGQEMDDRAENKVLTSAPPPWHSILLIVIFSVIFLAIFPSAEKLDEVATMETFTHVIFPEYLDIYAIAYIRAIIAFTIWAWMVHMALISDGWIQETTYRKGSKLKKVPNHMRGIKTLFPFTCVSWNLLGLSFTLSSYIALKGAKGSTVSPWILRLALAVWEMAAPNSLLVATVIRYVIWPGVLAQGGVTRELKSLRNIFMHNLNVLFAITESALLGGLPVRWSEISLAPLLGIAYVVFSWNMTRNWNKPEHGPQFIYFFFDTTLPGYAPSFALVALLLALFLFFAIFCTCQSVLEWADGGIIGSLVFVGAISSLVMRFRD